MWDELTPVPTRKISIRFIVTYAGFEGESELLQELYDRGKAGEVIPELADIDNGEGLPACRRNGRTFVYRDHELKQHPGLTISPQTYHEEQRVTLRPLAYLRIHENGFTSNEDIFITPEQWQACYSPDVRALSAYDGRRMVLGADASTTRDLYRAGRCVPQPRGGYCGCGVLPGVEAPAGRIPVRKTYGRSRCHDQSGDHAPGARRSGSGRGEYHPYQLHSIALDLEKSGVSMIEMPQTGARVESDQALYDAIIGKTIRHYGDPTLNEHITNAVAIETPRGFRLAKEKTSRKIDAAVALSMAAFQAEFFGVPLEVF